MTPMKPMDGMKPMEPMKPMASAKPWWPADLGEPSSSGAQDDMRYAFFPDARRLLVEENGKRTIYDSGDHRINGVSQQSSGGRSVAFSSDEGSVKVADLEIVD